MDDVTHGYPIDTTNLFLVSSRASDEKILVLKAPIMQHPISKEQALNLAAYLVAIADDSIHHVKFQRVLGAIENA